ncbi:MAG TPA: SGNH/GDSL hydrolase family protein, partial [Acetobacteraceae bacterium]
HSYPAILQADLSAALPDLHIAVLNRGVSGQDAPRESERIDADAIAVRPQLIIWQVGTNAALRRMDVEGFRADVVAGVRRAQAAGIDVVLMDNQRAPRVLAVGTADIAIDQALAQAAEETGVSLFSRDHLMEAWEEEGAPAADFTAPDKLHHNDRGYRCLARSLARAIVRAVRPPSLVAGP